MIASHSLATESSPVSTVIVDLCYEKIDISSSSTFKLRVLRLCLVDFSAIVIDLKLYFSTDDLYSSTCWTIAGNKDCTFSSFDSVPVGSP